VSEAIGPLSLRYIHPDPDGRDRLIGISAPSGGSCDCDVRRQVGIYTINQEER